MTILCIPFRFREYARDALYLKMPFLLIEIVVVNRRSLGFAYYCVGIGSRRGGHWV